MTATTFCQVDKNIDSLTNVLKTSLNDTNRVNALNGLGRNLCIRGDFINALNNVKEALIRAERIDFKKGIANAYNITGIIYIEQANYPEALKNYLIALRIRREMKDTKNAGRSLLNIGNIYLQQGNYPEALKNYFAALKTGDELNDIGIISNAYNGIGELYAQQGNSKEALKYLFSALRIRDKAGDKHGMSMSYVDIGNVYAKEGNYPEALKHFLASLEMEKEGGDQRTISYSYANLGNIYMKQGKYGEALRYQLAALKIEEDIGYKYGIVDSYISLGKIYLGLHKEIEARNYINKGLVLAKQNGNKEGIKDAYNILSEIDSLNGNMTSAYYNYRLFTKVKDSIVNEESNSQISTLKVQYETDKKDQQIKTQALQNSILQSRIYYSITISLIVLGIVVLLFYLRIRRKKREYDHILTTLELTALKSQLNPHFISNSLIAIKTFIDSEPGKASQFLVKFARLMRHVLLQSELPSISLKEELETTELYMQIESLRLKYGFEYKIECDPAIDKEMIIVPPLILQPAIENAIGHGLMPKKEKGYILITVKIEEGLLTFTIEDNGVGKKIINEVGRPPGDKSFGLSITRKRIQVLNRKSHKEGYLDLKFLTGRTITEVAFPVSNL